MPLIVSAAAPLAERLVRVTRGAAAPTRRVAVNAPAAPITSASTATSASLGQSRLPNGATDPDLLRGSSQQILDLDSRFADGLQSAFRILVETSTDQPPRGGGCPGRHRLPVRIRLQDRSEHVRDQLALEGPLTGQHLEQHAAERPDVGALVDGFPRACSGDMYAAVPRIIPACVIAGVVIVGDIETLDVTAPAGSSAFASPKSSTFTVPSGAHLDVGGFQIAMDDPLLVRGFEGFGDLLRDRQRFVERDGAARIRRCARSSPSTSSITSARTPPLSSRP